MRLGAENRGECKTSLFLLQCTAKVEKEAENHVATLLLIFLLGKVSVPKKCVHVTYAPVASI